jgi:hypothetical protein
MGKIDWARVWHVLTTSRYTRQLEAEIVDLKADNARLRRDNEGLTEALYPQVRRIRVESEAKAKDLMRPVAPRKKVGTFNSF